LKKSTSNGGEGDIAERFWKGLMKAAMKEKGQVLSEEEFNSEAALDIEWPMALVMSRKLE
jgi:hypothetical protein